VVRTLAALTLLGLALLLPPPAAGAEEGEEGRRRALLERLGNPADVGAVLLAVHTLHGLDSDEALEFARTLGLTAGYGAAEGVHRILVSPRADVRIEALRSAARIRLRHRGLVGQARERLRSGEAEERLAAVDLLGVVGDGRDVPVLLDLAADEDPHLQRAAYQALKRLSGATLPYRHARWTYWWEHQGSLAAEQVERAIERLEHRPDRDDAEDHVAVLRTLGWIDLVAVELALQAWFHRPEAELRHAACRLAGDLRLTDCVDEVRWAGHMAMEGEVRTAAQASLKALGAVEGKERAGAREAR
jgi:HEAT repeat protein